MSERRESNSNGETMPGMSPPVAQPPAISVVRRWRIRLLLVLLTVSVLYFPSFDLKLFADDYIAWSKVLLTIHHPWWRFFGTFYNPEFYRPFEHLLIRANVWLLGTDPLPYRLATVIGHLLMVAGVFWFARRLRLGYPESLFAALLFGLSQANAMAVLSNDAASLVFSTLCGTLAMGFALRNADDRPLPAWQAWFSACWLMGSLLWKDAGAGYVPALAILLALELRRTPGSARLRRGLALAAPFALVIALYLVLRIHAGATGTHFSPHGRYDIWFGLNLPVNIALFLLGMLMPVGSSIVVLRTGDFFFLGLCAAAVVVTTTLIVGGFRRSWKNHAERREPLVVLVLLLSAVMTPDVLMNKISELYLYKPNVLFSVLAGAALLELVADAWRARRRFVLAFLALFLATLLVSHTFSIRHKAMRLRDNGLRCERLMEEIKQQMPALASRKVIAVNRYPGPAPLYSIYYMEGVYVLGGAWAL